MRRSPASALALIALTLGVAAPATANAAVPAPFAAFDLNGTLTASMGPAQLNDLGWTTYGTDAAFADGRRVKSIPQYSGVQLALGSASGEATYTLAAHVRLDTVTGKRRLVDYTTGRRDDGIYVRDGRLVVYRSGSQVATSPAAVVTAGRWTHVVLTRTAEDTLTGYVDGEPVLTYTDGADSTVAFIVRLFRDDRWDATAGALARLRWFKQALSGDDVRALQPDKVDVTAPAAQLADTGGLIGGRPTVSGTVSDAGSAPYRIATAVQVLDGASVVAAGTATAGADGRWTLTYPASAPTLADGRTYTVRATSTDAAGNATTSQATVVADTAAPALAVTGPGAAAGERPTITGTAADARSTADRITAKVEVLDGDTLVMTATTTVNPDGTWSLPYPPGAPSLTEGRTYTLRATATDHLGNAATAATQALSDGVAPRGLTVDSPSVESSQPSPFIAGRATVGERDEAAVSITVLRGGAPVATFSAPIAGGHYTARVPVALPDGAYTAVVRQCDAVGNCAQADRGFTVTTPAGITGWQVQTPGRKAKTAAGSGETVAELLLASVLDKLAKKGPSGLAERSTLSVKTTLAGHVSVQVFAGAAPKATTAKAGGKKALEGLLAHGTRTFEKPGSGAIRVAATRSGRSRMRRAKTVKVTVRLTVTPKGGEPVTADRSLTLKRKR